MQIDDAGARVITAMLPFFFSRKKQQNRNGWANFREDFHIVSFLLKVHESEK